MNALDSISILICLAFLGLGISHGLIKSVSSLVAIIVGLFGAKKLEPFISTILSAVHLHNPKGLLGYLFVFFCIYIAVKIALLLLRKVTKASGLSPIDRAFGGLLGLVKGIIAVVLICTVMQVFLPKDSAILTHSKLLPYTRKIVSNAHVLIPAAVHRSAGSDRAQNLRETPGQGERKGLSNPASALFHRDKKTKSSDK
ncbi:MAG TPA: CvpA family protein [Deltaproteobacteria bacterium]|nr:CvpA family protein [Deltaproteobacteria bacterium]HQI01139.1 CvpA family protein [Deltaproteobacteria bacterium]HQJ07497.1 CvpA family protein [Deltaproteobacteria bacterium]